MAKKYSVKPQSNLFKTFLLIGLVVFTFYFIYNYLATGSFSLKPRASEIVDVSGGVATCGTLLTEADCLKVNGCKPSTTPDTTKTEAVKCTKDEATRGTYGCKITYTTTNNPTTYTTFNCSTLDISSCRSGMYGCKITYSEETKYKQVAHTSVTPKYTYGCKGASGNTPQICAQNGGSWGVVSTTYSQSTYYTNDPYTVTTENCTGTGTKANSASTIVTESYGTHDVTTTIPGKFICTGTPIAKVDLALTPSCDDSKSCGTQVNLNTKGAIRCLTNVNTNGLGFCCPSSKPIQKDGVCVTGQGTCSVGQKRCSSDKTKVEICTGGNIWNTATQCASGTMCDNNLTCTAVAANIKVQARIAGGTDVCSNEYKYGAHMAVYPATSCGSDEFSLPSIKYRVCPSNKPNCYWWQKKEATAICCVGNTVLPTLQGKCIGTNMTVNTTIVNKETAANDVKSISVNGVTTAIDLSRLKEFTKNGKVFYSAFSTIDTSGGTCIKNASIGCNNSKISGVKDINSVQVTTSAQKCDFTKPGSQDGRCCL